MTLSIDTFSITTLSIMALSIMGPVETLGIDIQHNSFECRDYLNVILSVIMLNIIMLSVIVSFKELFHKKFCFVTLKQ